MARSAVQAPLPSTRTRYHFEPGSYGGAGVFVPSIACYRVDDAGSRALHFVLVRPEAPRGEEHAASAAAQADIAAAFAGAPGSPGDSERVALALRSAGYVSVDDPRVVRD